MSTAEMPPISNPDAEAELLELKARQASQDEEVKKYNVAADQVQSDREKARTEYLGKEEQLDEGLARSRREHRRLTRGIIKRDGEKTRGTERFQRGEGRTYSGAFPDYVKQISKAEAQATEQSRFRKFIGRILLEPQHTPDTVAAYDRFIGAPSIREEARAAKREEIFAKARKVVDERLASGEIELEYPSRLRKIGKFVVHDLHNILGPSVPEHHEFLSNHYQHYLETLEREKEKQTNTTEEESESSADEDLKETSAAARTQERFDKAKELDRFGVQGIHVEAGYQFDPSKHNAVEITGEGDREEVVEVRRLGFQMDDGTIIRPADVVVHRYNEPEELKHGAEVEVDHENSDGPDAEVFDIDRERNNRNNRARGRRGGSRAERAADEANAESEDEGSAPASQEIEPRASRKRGKRGGSRVKPAEATGGTLPPLEDPHQNHNTVSETERIDSLVSEVNQEYLYELAQMKGNLSEEDRLTIQQSILRRFVPPFFGAKNLSEVPEGAWSRFADEIKLTPEERAELRSIR